MIIEIENQVSNRRELCICEFQGEVVGELPGNELGVLLLLEGGKVEMEIGVHALDGEVVSLKQPFLVVETKGGGQGNMDILGIVRKKILFKTRPKPRA